MKRAYRDTAQGAKPKLAKSKLLIASLALSAMINAPALGQSYSYEEQEACTGDAFRLCSEFIPDIPRITSCMYAKRQQLSPRCAKMFTAGRDRHLGEQRQQPFGDADDDQD